MGFIMDGLEAEAYDRSYTDRELIARIWNYFKPQSRRMLIVGVTVFLAAGFDTALPVLTSYSLDLIAKEGTKTSTILLVGGIIIASGVFSWLSNYIRRRISTRAVGDVVLELRKTAFKAVMARDLSFYDEYPTGKIVSRVTSDTQEFANVVQLTIDLISQILLVVLLLIVLFSINTTLALVVIGFAPLVVAIALVFRRFARYVTQQSRRVLAEVNANIQESVSGITVAKAYRQEHEIYHTFDEINRRAYRINLRQGFTFSSIFPILNLTAATLGTTTMVYLGGVRVADGVITAGAWWIFIQALDQFWFPLTSIASFWSQFQNGLSASERVFALVDADPKVIQTDHQKVGRLRGHIEFKQVDFRYTDEESVLNRFSLDIKAGETIALVGHTGAGKSSIGKLIARFYEFQGGQILADGRDIRTFDLQDYRRNLGIVNQTPFLFSGTVRDNIRYVLPDAADADIEAVVQKVANGDWVDTLVNGLDTEVGERGSAISMGQRQLVALCRVLLKDPPIFILDEATASVDPLTEAQIQEGLDTVLENRTSIVIAHRLSTIKNADRIIVLRQGEIIEEGTHESLLRDGGHYADLYNTYFRHQSLDYIESSAVSRYL
ncbi:MAG: ABC transporter ATP-binding protein [Anaerolineae bacterium]|nr:MAG: ABC transporter ATP-binding protein [Anaerolineae bacterium]